MYFFENTRNADTLGLLFFHQLEEALALDFADFEDAVLCQAGVHAGAGQL